MSRKPEPGRSGQAIRLNVKDSAAVDPSLQSQLTMKTLVLIEVDGKPNAISTVLFDKKAGASREGIVTISMLLAFSFPKIAAARPLHYKGTPEES